MCSCAQLDSRTMSVRARMDVSWMWICPRLCPRQHRPAPRASQSSISRAGIARSSQTNPTANFHFGQDRIRLKFILMKVLTCKPQFGPSSIFQHYRVSKSVVCHGNTYSSLMVFHVTVSIGSPIARVYTNTLKPPKDRSFLYVLLAL